MTGLCPFPELLPRPSRAATVAALILVACALVGRAVYCFTPVNSDTAMFVYAGKLVASGGKPGIDLIDNKLPSVGLLMSVPYRVLGAHWSAYGVLGFLMSLAASAVLARAAKHVLGHSAAIVVGVASCVWLNFTPAVFGQLQLETITACFATLAGACALHMFRRFDLRDAFTLGLCAGMGMWAKPTCGAVIPAAIAAILLVSGWPWRMRLVGVFWIMLGVLTPVIICAWLIVVCGMADALPATFAQLHDYASASTFDAMDAAKPVIVVGFVLFPLLVLGFIFRRDREASCTTRTISCFAILWFVAELAGVIAQRRMYAYHFIVLGPPAALLAGLFGRRLRVMSLTMAFGPAIAIAVVWAIMLVSNSPAESRDDRLIAYVRDHVDPAESVWVDDYPRLMVETGLHPGSAVPLVFLFANSADSPRRFGDRLLSDFANRQPAMIVLPSDTSRVIDLYRNHMAEVASDPLRQQAFEKALTDIDHYVADHYHAESSLEGRTFWRRNVDPAATTVNLPRD